MHLHKLILSAEGDTCPMSCLRAGAPTVTVHAFYDRYRSDEMHLHVLLQWTDFSVCALEGPEKHAERAANRLLDAASLSPTFAYQIASHCNKARRFCASRRPGRVLFEPLERAHGQTPLLQ